MGINSPPTLLILFSLTSHGYLHFVASVRSYNVAKPHSPLINFLRPALALLSSLYISETNKKEFSKIIVYDIDIRQVVMLSQCTNNVLSTSPSPLLLVAFLGFLSLLSCSISLLKWVYSTFLRQPRNLEQYGSWALVTGATDGIGKAFARQLAQEGLNLILVGRNPTKLDTVSSEILAEFPDTKVKVVLFDFASKVSSSSSSATAGVEPIQEATKGLDVGVLINNVGITYPSAKFFHEVEENVWMEMVRVNLEGTTRVTKAVLPGMVRRRRGAIVNVGSGAAVVVPSHPLFTIYAATKAYIDQLSRSLYVEYKRHGIDVQCQVPLYVATKMTSRVASVERTSLFIPSPEDYVKSAIRCIGYEPRCTPYWAHSLQWFFARLLPDSILDAWRLSIGISRREAALININHQG